jgi:RHS repeat-associated protein
VWGGPVGAVTGRVNWTYDSDFRVTSESVNGATPIGFTYDADSLLTGVGALSLTRDPQTGFVTGTALGSLTDTRSFSTFGELASYQATVGTAPLLATQYTRDSLGRITQKAETLGGVTDTSAYTYDLAGRLTEVRQNGALIASYGYDANSNRASRTTPSGTVTGTYDAQDRLLTYGDASYTYTANGELAGKTTPAGTTTYLYDVVGNLLAVTLPDGRRIDYVVDGRNRRIGKKVNGVLVQGFLYRDQLKPVAELDGAGNVIAQFVYGSSPVAPDYIVKGGTTYRLVGDHLGSPRLAVDTATGAIVQRLDYDEFGQVILDTNPGFQPFGFAGGLYDLDTRLTRFGVRDYDPGIGRWTAKDLIQFRGGDTNLYGYVLGDPLNLLDPWGLYTEVLTFQPVGWGTSSFGHTAVNINGTVYSWGPNGLWSGPLEEYLQKNAFRDAVGSVLKLTPEQESSIEKFIKGFPNSNGKFGITTRNCGDPIESALEQLGFNLGINLFPVGLAYAFEDAGIVQRYNFYPVTVPPDGMNAPWAK